MTVHTSREFERELRTLRDRLLAMGGRAEQQIQRAIDALMRCDDSLADQVISEDQSVDLDEVEIDELAFLILARRQPVASDLRFVMLALKIDVDLERIADLAVNIAKRTRELNQHPPQPMYLDIQRLAARVMGALRQALDSFSTGNAAAAEQVILCDHEIDALNTQVIGAVLTEGVREPEQLARWLALSSVSRYLERIADHATNIAEMVIYYVRGSAVRHHRISRVE